jgi:hypothetical protein
MKRFSVSEKFAGKSGPCPNCQKQIKIPEKKDEVVIHAPEDSGPKDSKGKAILKPIRRKEVSLSLPVILAASLGTLVVFGVALGLGLSGDQPPTALLAVASIVLALPLVFVGYWFLHDDELEGFRGRPLWIRCGICSLVFAMIWGLYAVVPAYISGYSSMAEISGLDMVIFLPIMIAIGAAVSVATLELEVVQGVLHYMFYFGVTFVLAWLAGTPLASPLAGDAASTGAPRPAVTSPSQPGPANRSTEPEEPAAEGPAKQIPNLLQ